MVELTEELLPYLPKEIRLYLEDIASEGHAALAKVTKQLNAMHNLSRALAHLGALRYAQEQLAAYQLQLTMESFYELDMLLTAFVVMYIRLERDGGGHGFTRNELPDHLRKMHDEVRMLRQKRFAHDDQDSEMIVNEMVISVEDGDFVIHPRLSMRYQIGGNPDWVQLVDAIEGIIMQRIAKLIRTIEQRTGYGWRFAQNGPI